MTNRDRIVGTLSCLPVDRPPYGVGIGFAPWSETWQRWREESGLEFLNVADYFGFDAGFQIVPAEYGPLPRFEQEVLRENVDFVVSRDYRGIVMRNRRDLHSMPEFIQHPIRGWDDWRAYKEQRLQPRIERRLEAVGDFLAAAAGVDAPVQVGAFPWGVFGTARDLMGAEELLYALYDQPDLVQDIMTAYTDLWLAIYEAVAAMTRIDHIHIWEDMAGRQGSLISMEMVERFMMPQYDRIADFARRHGVPLVSVDSDGLVDELVEVMVRHGVNVYFPFEVAAGNDIEQFRRLHPKLGIWGGLDKRALAAGGEALHRELDRAERMLACGGYIPGCDHLIPPDVSWANWKYFCEHLRKLCGA